MPEITHPDPCEACEKPRTTDPDFCDDCLGLMRIKRAAIDERASIVRRLREMARVIGLGEVSGTALTLEKAAAVIEAEQR